MCFRCFPDWEDICTTLDLNSHLPKPPPEEKEKDKGKDEEKKAEKEGDEKDKENEKVCFFICYDNSKLLTISATNKLKVNTQWGVEYVQSGHPISGEISANLIFKLIQRVK